MITRRDVNGRCGITRLEILVVVVHNSHGVDRKSLAHDTSVAELQGAFTRAGGEEVAP